MGSTDDQNRCTGSLDKITSQYHTTCSAKTQFKMQNPCPYFGGSFSESLLQGLVKLRFRIRPATERVRLSRRHLCQELVRPSKLLTIPRSDRFQK
jgi:hypothetical protein